jgi:hypothetical protein
MTPGERQENLRGVTTQDFKDRYLNRQAIEAGLTGEFGGDPTMQREALESDLETQNLARRLSEAEATGEFRDGARMRDTMQKEAMDFERDRSRIGSMLSAIDLLDKDSNEYKAIVEDLGDTTSGGDFKARLRKLLGVGSPSGLTQREIEYLYEQQDPDLQGRFS